MAAISQYLLMLTMEIHVEVLHQVVHMFATGFTELQFVYWMAYVVFSLGSMEVVVFSDNPANRMTFLW